MTLEFTNVKDAVNLRLDSSIFSRLLALKDCSMKYLGFIEKNEYLA